MPHRLEERVKVRQDLDFQLVTVSMCRFCTHLTAIAHQPLSRAVNSTCTGVHWSLTIRSNHTRVKCVDCCAPGPSLFEAKQSLQESETLHVTSTRVQCRTHLDSTTRAACKARGYDECSPRSLMLDIVAMQLEYVQHTHIRISNTTHDCLHDRVVLQAVSSGLPTSPVTSVHSAPPGAACPSCLTA